MKTILIVDDNKDFCSVFKELYSGKKYKIIEAHNPLSALEHFNKNNFEIDIVVCDFYLPIQNGNDFLEIVKKKSPNVKCLLISADDDIKERKFPYVDNTFSKFDLDEIKNYLDQLESEFSYVAPLRRAWAA